MSIKEKEQQDFQLIYEEFDGNFGDISNIKRREDLPENAKKYLDRIEEVVKVPIKFIGTGADRDNMIIVKQEILWKQIHFLLYRLLMVDIEI